LWVLRRSAEPGSGAPGSLVGMKTSLCCEGVNLAVHPARTALITGGSHGIGYRMCLELAAAGTSVLVHAPNLAEARAATVRLAGNGADPALLHPVSADFRRLDEVRSLAGDLRLHHDGLDLLINNAGALAPPAGLGLHGRPTP
jgi:NAD(P)-dependent dehydrogenase (short-subunit alcohol dehydrogenase family)